MSDTNTTAAPRREIGRYEIVRLLGRGGMAAVYLARQRDLDRHVALKELASFGINDPQMVHRFLREAQIAASLSDPNIVAVHEAFAAGGVPYISMEYLARGSLRPLVGRLDLGQSVAVIDQVLGGLEAAERLSVVHRDLKPENLLVTGDGHVKIADFGIAKAVDHAATAEFKTATGMTVGTPSYMAPEQALGKPLTGATDLYSLGVIAYELMVGRLPFEAESPVALLMHHVSEAPPPPLAIKPDLDPELAGWIERLLVKEPADRTPSATVAREGLEDIALRLFGPRWRRNATLPDPRTVIGAPAVIDTPEPTGRSTVDEYFTVKHEPLEHPPPASDPVVPAPPFPTSAVQPAAPAPEEPRRRIAKPVWLATLVLLAVVAAAISFLVRPGHDRPPPAPTPTPTAPGATATPARFGTAAYTLQLPPGWSTKCAEDEGECRNVRTGKRSELLKGTGAQTQTASIDRFVTKAGITVASALQDEDTALKGLEGYKRAGSVSTQTLADGRRAREFAWTSDVPELANGTVVVFRERGNIYVVAGTGPDRGEARSQTEAIAGAIRTR